MRISIRFPYLISHSVTISHSSLDMCGRWRVGSFTPLSQFQASGGKVQQMHRLQILDFPRIESHNKSQEPTAVGAVSSAVAVHAASRRGLSFFPSALAWPG